MAIRSPPLKHVTKVKMLREEIEEFRPDALIIIVLFYGESWFILTWNLTLNGS